MNMSKMLNLFVLVFLSINFGGCGQKDAPKISGPMRAELDKAVTELACMPTREFPHKLDPARNQTCIDCEKLVEAGLLEREENDASTYPEDNLPAEVSYNLTDIGESAYVPATGEGEYAHINRFCFGNSHVLRVTSTFGPVMFGREKNLGIRYIARLDNANPYLFDPRARLLGIQLPNAAIEGQPVLYPEQNITAVISLSNPNEFYLDASLQIGPLGMK